MSRAPSRQQSFLRACGRCHPLHPLPVFCMEIDVVLLPKDCFQPSPAGTLQVQRQLLSSWSTRHHSVAKLGCGGKGVLDAAPKTAPALPCSHVGVPMTAMSFCELALLHPASYSGLGVSQFTCLTLCCPLRLVWVRPETCHPGDIHRCVCHTQMLPYQKGRVKCTGAHLQSSHAVKGRQLCD